MIQTIPMNAPTATTSPQSTGQNTNTSTGTDFETLMAQMMGQQSTGANGMLGGTDPELQAQLAQLLGEDSEDPTDPTNAMEMLAGLFLGTAADVSFAPSPMAYHSGTATDPALLNLGGQPQNPGTATLNGELVTDPQLLQALLDAQAQQTGQTGQDYRRAVDSSLVNQKWSAKPIPGQLVSQSTLETLMQSDPKLAAELMKNGGITLEQTAVPQQLDPTQSAFAKLYGEQQPATAKPATGTDVEALQQAVDNGAYLPQSLTSAKELGMAAPHEMEILRQVQTGILENLQKDKNEFTIKLKPEGLGAITVKMTELAGKISLTIITSTQQAQNALSGELNSLKEALRPYNAEVQQIVQSNDTAAFQQSMSEQRRNGQQGAPQQTGYYHDPEAEASQEIQQEYARLMGTMLNTRI